VSDVLAPIERWTSGRKEAVLREIQTASPEERAEILRAHGITEDEVASWGERFTRFGRPGLAQHKLQELRT